MRLFPAEDISDFLELETKSKRCCLYTFSVSCPAPLPARFLCDTLVFACPLTWNTACRLPQVTGLFRVAFLLPPGLMSVHALTYQLGLPRASLFWMLPTQPGPRQKSAWCQGLITQVRVSNGRSNNVRQEYISKENKHRSGRLFEEVDA